MTVVPQADSTVDRASPRLAMNVLRQPLAVCSLAYLAMVTVVAVTAPLIAPYDPAATDLDHVLAGPGGAHLLGTDILGRDVLSRLIFAGQTSLAGVAQALITFLALGVPAGLMAGFFGGWLDRLVTWIADVALAIPAILILLVVLAVFGSNETAAMMTLGLLGAPGLARIVRGATVAVRHEPYIAAAKVSGLSRTRIVARHVLPRVTGPIIVQGSIFAGVALLTESGLGYLGLGVQPPTPTWGGMVADASTVIDQQPWLLVPSGLVIVLAILSFGLIGDAVRDATAEHSGTTPAQHQRWRIRRNRPEQPATPPAPDPDALLSVRNLSIAFPHGNEMVTVVDDLNLDIHPGETVGVVGESGCGKTVTARAVLGLLEGGRITSGSITLNGTELTRLGPRDLRRIRGTMVALVPQNPAAGLDPTFTVGQQLDELVRKHNRTRRKTARATTLELLDKVSLPNPRAVARLYPHQLSGGMAQRVAIASALAGRPRLLIADEPTTALDVTVQAEILALLRNLQRDTGMSILLVTHDWGVVADLCHRALVMYAGHVVESSSVDSVFKRPLHPYTVGLLNSNPYRAHPRRPLQAIAGMVPSPRDWPTGCHFHPRCPLASTDCVVGPIELEEQHPDHHTRCIHYDRVTIGAAG